MTAVNQLPRIVILTTLAVAHWSCGGGEPTGTTQPPPPPPDNTVASVSISGGTGVDIAGTLQLTATAATSSGATVSTTFSWSSSNNSLATVNQSGLVTGVAPGSVTITATASGTSISDTHSVTVTAPLPVSSVVVSPGSATLLEDFTQQLSADPQDANGNTVAATVSWTSDNVAVATVNNTGLVTGIVAGNATITATADAVPGTAQIIVEIVTLANHVQPIFTGNCALSGCHTGAFPEETLDLSVTLAWSNIVNVVSVQANPAMNRVTPFDPSQSYLVHKIEGTQGTVGGSGVQMPFGRPALSSQNIAIIRSWITKGALDN